MENILYGARAAQLVEVGQVVASALRSSFSERESDYLGVYLQGFSGSTKVRVVSQPDPEGELLEPDFPEYRTLVYLDGADTLPSLDGLEFEEGIIDLLRR